MENEKLNDRWREAIKNAETHSDTFIWSEVFDKAEKIYNQPEFVPLCEKIFGELNHDPNVPGITDGKNICLTNVTKERLNEAVKDIDYPCKKIHFPEVTVEMIDDLIHTHDGKDACQIAIEKVRQNCKEGKYEKPRT